MHLAGAVVVVTGATRGIGRSTARLLAARGATVVPVGRDAALLDEVGQEVGEPGLTLDLRDPAAAEQVVAHSLDRHARLDAVVSGAGVGHAGDVALMPVDRVAELVSVNLLAPLLLARAALPPMRRQGRGTLLFVTSVAGALGVPGESVYSATKAGLETFAEVLREEVSADGVTVTTVLPGVVETGFFATRGRPYDRRFPRPLPPEQLAAAVVGALEGGQRRVVVPRWLAAPARLRSLSPVLYRALERRLG